jgi:flagellar biosynthetic protein FliP
MSPVFSEMNQKALQPYMAKEISFESLYKEAAKPLKNFMLRQTGENELALFVRMSKAENPKGIDDVSFWVVVPAFMLSELKTAFIIGFLIFIPFLVIDMVVSSVLMAMGMMMLPPMMVSTPFKLILFVLVDGWTLIVKQLVLSFH